MYKNQSDEQKKQLINSIDAFRAFLSAQSHFKRMAGSMYWGKYGSETYLVKEDPSKRKHRLGLRSETTEALKTDRDLGQAKAVGRLIQDRLPQFEIADIPAFPSSLLNLAKRLGIWEMNADENTDGDNFSFPLI